MQALERARFDPPVESFYFFHIPKTAGTSLRIWFQDQFAASEERASRILDDYAQMSAEERCQCRFFSDHFGFRLLELLPRRPATVTWLREPLARRLSLQMFQERRFDHLVATASERSDTAAASHYERVRATALAPVGERRLDFAGNVQVQYLAGVLPSEKEEPPCDETTLDRAKKNLEGLDHFGICEWMGPSVDLLCYRWAVPRQPLSLSLNQAPVRSESRLAELTAQERDILRESNRHDEALYAWAKQEFSRRFRDFWNDCGLPPAPYFPGRIPVEYGSPQVQAAIGAALATRFQRMRSETEPIREARIDFSEATYLSGWYPRQPQPESGWFRWAGPGLTSSVYVPLVPGRDYRVRFTVLFHKGQDILQSLRLRVGDAFVPLTLRQMPARNGIAAPSEMSGCIPAEALASRDPFTEIVFEVNRTVRMQRQRGEVLDVSFATDGLELEAQ
jgi:hypothetical protein